MGVIAVGLVYDLVRRRFGRAAGFVAGLALASTPVAVAVSRHNNPDELLVLCCVAALWFAVRAFETGRTRWLVLSGIAVGLGFETKMGVALMVVPGIAAAWIWIGPSLRGRLARAAGAAGGRCRDDGRRPRLAAARDADAGRRSPVDLGHLGQQHLVLIFGYNGLGRVAGQTGGPAGGGGGPGPGGGGGGGGNALFGGATGPFRLLQTGLGDQAGWLLGFALVAGLSLLVLTRLRRRDPRTGWLIAVGGAFLTTAVTFSFASGIFHPYYVSLLAPFAALLIGAGVGEMLPAPFGVARGRRSARIIAPLAIVAGAITELVVLGNLNGQLSWAGAAGDRDRLRVGDPARRAPCSARPRRRSSPSRCSPCWPRPRPGRPRPSATRPAGPSPAAARRARRWAAPAAGPVGGPAASAAPAACPACAGGPGAGGFGGPSSGGFGAAPGTAGAAGASGQGQLGTGFADRRPADSVSGKRAAAACSAATAPRSPPRSLRQGTWRRDDRRLESEQRRGRDPVEQRRRRRPRRLLRTRELGQRNMDRLRGPVRAACAGCWRTPATTGRLPGDTRTGSQSAISVVEKSCKSVTFTTSNGSKVTMYDCPGRASAILNAVQQPGWISPQCSSFRCRYRNVLWCACGCRSRSSSLRCSPLAAPAALADTVTSSNWAGYAVHRAGIQFKKRRCGLDPAERRLHARTARRTPRSGSASAATTRARTRSSRSAPKSTARRPGKIDSTVWYELVPAPPRRRSRCAFAPGTACTRRSPSTANKVVLTILDATTHRSFKKTLRASSGRRLLG